VHLLLLDILEHWEIHHQHHHHKEIMVVPDIMVALSVVGEVVGERLKMALRHHRLDVVVPVEMELHLLSPEHQ
jgi:hypothetical protein